MAELQPRIPAAGEHKSPSRYQTIRKWSVVGNDRVIGSVYNRPGQSDGRTIMTSPVVEVRLMGEWRTPVAFTESGNSYWLGVPAGNFGKDRAEQFVWTKSRKAAAAQPPARRPRETGMRTTIMKLLD